MEEKLDFSLPDKKPKRNAASAICIVLLLLLVGLVSADLFVALSPKQGHQTARRQTRPKKPVPPGR
ncbi:MAG: hypothetical protein ACYS76_14585 [Planctomycetota bacterium]|jgi:hypothetical protein